MASKVLAVIPARGGSKRVPQKNIREVNGRPLIAYTIDQAEAADRIDRAIVSTDSSDIEQVARKFGGEVPFTRPEGLATDTAALSETITHALEWATDLDQEYDIVCSLQTTTPLRTSNDIDSAIDRLEETNAMSCISTSEYTASPFWAVTTNNSGYLEEFIGKGALWANEPTRSQDLPNLVHPNGAVFASTVDAWRKHESFYTPETVGYEMPPERSLDIDEPWELELIRKVMEGQLYTECDKTRSQGDI
jgi:N-acylneuraminate cytidylyltransferase